MKSVSSGKGKGKGTIRGLGGVASRRRPAVRVKAKRQRSNSSRQWLQRHLNDPYVIAAQEDGYRSRAAFKLMQLDEKFHILKPGMRIVDLGAAPGGWSEVAAKINGGKGKIVAIDILHMDPLPDVDFVQMDFLVNEAPAKLKSMLKGYADVVLSDLAPSTTGHTGTDHIRIMNMADFALHFAMEVLAPGGTFVCKFFQGGAEKEILALLKKHFVKVKHAKPPASRTESSETYMVAQGFRKSG